MSEPFSAEEVEAARVLFARPVAFMMGAVSLDGLPPGDLPGYGFARVSKGAARKFQDLGRDYLRGRSNLKRVYLLIDARHGLKDTDAEALDALDLAAVSYQIVLTKADKLKTAEVEAMTAATLSKVAKRPAAFPRVIATSAEKGAGLAELRAEIVAAAFA